MNRATVMDRAQRDMIPDHEVPKYQRRAPLGVVTRTETATISATTTTEDDQATHSEDYDSLTVYIPELPTPRPFGHTTAASAVLASNFFSLDVDDAVCSSSPDTSRSLTETTIESHDFDHPGDAIPMIRVAPVYSSPVDSQAQRTRSRQHRKLGTSSE